MNHLAHLYLAGSEGRNLAGAFLGDTVKGSLDSFEPATLRQGIALHRAIDAFSDSHPICIASRTRFEPEFRRFGGIMTDIIHDHFLAKSWSYWHDEPLRDYATNALKKILHLEEPVSQSVLQLCRTMIERDSIPRYIERAFVERSFSYLSGRVSRRNPLDRAVAQFDAHHLQLQQDFEQFFPELIEYCHDWNLRSEN